MTTTTSKYQTYPDFLIQKKSVKTLNLNQKFKQI